MDMFSGINGEIVMDVKDYIREKCGNEIFDHIEFYITFYERVLSAYESNHESNDYEGFYDDVVCEL